jgi:hypothetical protein
LPMGFSLGRRYRVRRARVHARPGLNFRTGIDVATPDIPASSNCTTTQAPLVGPFAFGSHFRPGAGT